MYRHVFTHRYATVRVCGTLTVCLGHLLIIEAWRHNTDDIVSMWCEHMVACDTHKCISAVHMLNVLSGLQGECKYRPARSKQVSIRLTMHVPDVY